MYAAVMYLKFEPSLASAAAETFTTKLLPKVKAADGFRGGYWLDPAGGRGLGFLLFDTNDQARSASAVENWTAPGVTIDSVEVHRVAATA